MASKHWISWSAFCNDNHPPIRPPIFGDRIILNYKLFVSIPLEKSTSTPLIDCPEELLLVETIVESLHQKDFMQFGGTFGFYCTHIYGHANEMTNDRFPHSLRGVEFTIYSIMKYCEDFFNNLKVSVKQTLYFHQYDNQPIDLEQSNGLDQFTASTSNNQVTRVAKEFFSPIIVTHGMKNDNEEWPPRVREVYQNILDIQVDVLILDCSCLRASNRKRKLKPWSQSNG